MNSPNSTAGGLGPGAGSVGMLSSDKIGGIAYGIGVSVVMLLLIATVVLAVNYCTRSTNNSTASSGSPAQPPRRQTAMADDVEAGGLDEATLTSYSKVFYSQSQVRLCDKGGAASCCAICLSDYKDADVLRALPECGHLFHSSCIDPWLRSRPTCPLCRTSPQPTPLVEIVPLARQP